MKLLTHIPSWLKNKYLVAIGIFTAVMLFFDKNDLFMQISRTRQLRDLEESKQYYIKRIAEERKELESLLSDPITLEKYAREKYLMKKENEEIFLIPEGPGKSK